MFSSSSCMYWLVSYRWIYTLSSKLLLSLWPCIGECNYLGSHNSDIRNDPVVSGARMLMYGLACPCMCLQASVHSCSAGSHFFGITSLWLQSIVTLTIILQKYLINFNYICNCQLTLCLHPSKHASLSLCMRVCVCEMCLRASVHNIMCSAQPEVAAVLDWYGAEADPAYWQRGKGRSGQTPGSVRSTQSTCRRKILGASPRILDPLILITYNNVSSL